MAEQRRPAAGGIVHDRPPTTAGEEGRLAAGGIVYSWPRQKKDGRPRGEFLAEIASDQPRNKECRS